MIRSLTLCAAFLAGFSFLTGCGGGGTEPKFEEAQAQTPEEIQAAEDYEAELKRMEQENYGGN